MSTEITIVFDSTKYPSEFIEGKVARRTAALHKGRRYRVHDVFFRMQNDMENLRFKAVTSEPYGNFLLVPLRQKEH